MNSDNYQAFVIVTGALAKLVIIARCSNEVCRLFLNMSGLCV